VEGELRADLDDHLDLLRALVLVEVDAAVADEHRQRRGLPGLVAEAAQGRRRQAADVELAPRLGAEPDGRRAEGVAGVARDGLHERAGGQRLQDPVHDRLAQAEVASDL
jgi:hypothetical protein